ncbi:MAG TPA: aspartate--tRNA(Asn) ligase [Streptosporangiaceae bacterium]
MSPVSAGLPRTLAAHLPQAAPGTQVLVEGWVHRRRALASVTFVVVRDRSGQVQIVVRDPQALAAARDGLGFTEIQTPKFVSSATESGANVFHVDHFGRPAYLAQSPQFYKQTMVGVFERVYETGPVFRAEPHDTARHLAEYVSLDAELGFIADHRDVLSVLRHALAEMTAAVRASYAADVLGITIPDVPEQIPVIHFTEALRLAGARQDDPDLAPADERAVGRWAAETHGSEFVAVEGYPMSKRPFYTHPQPGDGRWSNSFDLLFRGLELVTGGQRLHRYSDYVAAIRARGEDPSAYKDYLEAFAHGMPPHGGFAIGLERWTARLTQAENIREVTLFPRDLRRLTP